MGYSFTLKHIHVHVSGYRLDQESESLDAEIITRLY